VLQSASLPAPVLTCAQPVVDHSVLYWAVTPEASIRSFQKGLENLIGPLGAPPSSPFQPFPGFYLACEQAGTPTNSSVESLDEIARTLETPLELRFPAMMLSCLQLGASMHPEPEQWWQGISWEGIRRVRLRKTGK